MEQTVDIHSLGNRPFDVSTQSFVVIALRYERRGYNTCNFCENVALKDWPDTKFALLCISIALPSRSSISTTSEATDTRGPTGCYCSDVWFLWVLVSAVASFTVGTVL